MASRLALPPLYVILDAALLPSDPIEVTKKLLDAEPACFNTAIKRRLRASCCMLRSLVSYGAPARRNFPGE